MVNIFGMNLFGCSICNGRHHKMGKHLMMKKTMKQKKYRGGYVYNKKGDNSIAGEDVTNSLSHSGRRSRSQSTNHSEYGKGLNTNSKTHNKSHKRRRNN